MAGQAGDATKELGSVEFRQRGDNLAVDKVTGIWEYPQDMFSGNLLRVSQIKYWEQGKLGAYMYFRTRFEVPLFNSRNYLVILDPAGEGFNSGDVGSFCGGKGGYDFNNRTCSQGGSAMLTPVVEGLDLSQKPSQRLLPVVVRLYAFDEPNYVTMNARERAGNLVFKFLGTSANGELDVLFGPFSGGAQWKDQVVKGTPELVGDLSNEDGAVSGKRNNIFNAENRMPFSINIGKQTIETSFEMGFAKIIECFEVLLGPSHFEPNVLH